MPGHIGLSMVAAGSLLTAVLPAAYTLEAPQHAQVTPDLAPTPLPPQTEGQRLTRHADGFFYATARINGHPMRLLVDTGASAIMLSPTDARRLGVPIGEDAFDGRVRTSSGVVRMAHVTIDRVTVGGQTFEDVPAMVLEGSAGVGLMGQSMLSRFRSVSIEGDVLALR